MKKFICLFLALCLAMAALCIPTAAQEAVPLPLGELTEEDLVLSDEGIIFDEQEISLEEELTPLQKLTEDCKILQYVDEQAFAEANHAFRLPHLEELDTYVFQNPDGTRSVYYLYENVKYIDEQGNVREKDNTLCRETAGYRIAENEFDLLLPHSITDGVELSYKGYDVKLIPGNETPGDTLTTVNLGTLQDNSVVYDEFFGAGTSLVYTPLLSGVKEEIVLEEYLPNQSFDFLLQTDGLYLVQQDGRYVLSESTLSTDAVLQLGSIVVYDAVGRPSLGNMTVETVKDGLAYLLTVSADENFLSDPATVYPVTIDPDMTILQDGGGTGTGTSANTVSIEDTTIYSGTPNLNTSDWVYNTAGYVDETYGTGRVLVRLPGVYNSAEFQGLTASRITSAYFYCTRSSVKDTQSVHLFRCTTSWDASTVTWNSFGNGFFIDPNWGKAVGTETTVSFDITTLVQGWRNNTYDPEKGFVLLNNHENDATKKFGICSAEHSNSEKRPYFVLSYQVAIWLSSSSLALERSGTRILSVTTDPAGGAVTWSSSNDYVATVSDNGVVEAISPGIAIVTARCEDDDGNEYSAQCTVYVWMEGLYAFYNPSQYKLLQLDGYNAYFEDSEVLGKAGNTHSETDRTTYFKVNYLQNGLYSIRSMVDNTMGLKRSGNGIICGSIGTTNETVPENAKWAIGTNSRGCYLYQYDGSHEDPQHTLICAPTILAINDLALQPYDEENELQAWTFTEVSVICNGVDIWQKKSTVVVGESYTFDAAIYSINLHHHGGNGITWSVTNDTGSATINPNTGVLTATSVGSVTVTATYARSATQEWSASHTVRIILPDGIYLMRNRQTEFYAEVKNKNVPLTSLVQQSASSTGEEQRWLIEHRYNGYFTIKSLLSDSSAYYLCVKNDSDNLNSEIILNSGSVTNGMLWRFEPTTNGAFKVIPKTGEAEGYVLATTTSLPTDGAKLIQGEYVVNTSYRDEWYITRQAWSLGGEFIDGEDVLEAVDHWEACGFHSCENIDASVDDCGANQLSSAIVYFSTHGEQWYITFDDDTNIKAYASVETANEGESIVIGDYDLSSAELYVYNACYTASGDYNLCTATIQAGAKCVIGWATQISAFDGRAWQNKFQSRLVAGATVREAVDYANSFFYDENDKIKTVRIFGDENLVVNLSARLDEGIATFPVEEGLLFTEIPYESHSEEAIKAILRANSRYYLDDPCDISVTQSNDSGDCYVIDLNYLESGKYPMDCGYSIIVKEGVITCIRENSMEEYYSDGLYVERNTNSLGFPTLSLCPEDKEIYVQRAILDFTKSLSPDYMIVAKEAEIRYDYSNRKHYCLVSIVYMVPSGASGAIDFKYFVAANEESV